MKGFLFTARISVSVWWPDNKVHSARTIGYDVAYWAGYTQNTFIKVVFDLLIKKIICILIMKKNKHGHSVQDL